MNEEAENPPEGRIRPDTDPDCSGWVERHYVRAISGLSEREIDTLVAQNKIRHEDRPMPGRRPIVVYCLDDVKAILRERMASHAAVATTPEERILFMQQVIGELYVENRKMREMLNPSFLRART